MFGDHGFMGGFMWIFWIAVLVGLFFLIKWIVQQNKSAASKLEESALEVLKRRYAKGEIERDEFEQKKKRKIHFSFFSRKHIKDNFFFSKKVTYLYNLNE